MLTVLDHTGNTIPIDADPSIELENFKAFLEVDTHVPAEHQSIHFQGRELTDNKASLASCGVRDGDLLMMSDIRTRAEQTPSITDDSQMARLLQSQILKSPQLQNELRQVCISFPSGSFSA